ncbi:hypothetical protein [Pseudoduganella violaceinigra]|uniref:hypothetical protein n=1 Tax=Pseudoduganella violaceinigra TaxID=246602 RepID=UPI0004110970|nr:hypothetical protein [Pseudoduganella violaceinigra]
MEYRCVADIAGPWLQPDFESGLIARCRENWSIPVGQISNYVLATFIRQEIAWVITIPEARRRIAAGFFDDSESYDNELFIAVSEALIISFVRYPPNDPTAPIDGNDKPAAQA